MIRAWEAWAANRNAREITRHARLEPGSGIDVASLEEHQSSCAEYYSAPESTARQISQIRADGGRGVRHRSDCSAGG